MVWAGDRLAHFGAGLFDVQQTCLPGSLLGIYGCAMGGSDFRKATEVPKEGFAIRVSRIEGSGKNQIFDDGLVCLIRHRNPGLT